MVKTQAETEAREQNRMTMHTVTKNMKLLFWGYIVLVAVFTILGLAASALQASNEANVGPAKWYYGFEAGMLEIAVAVLTLVLAVMISMKNRIGAIVLLGLHAVLFTVAITGVLVTFTEINIIPTALGVVLGIWGQVQFKKLEYLSGQPGFPYFSAQDIEQPAHYDSLYHVRRAQSPADKMNQVGEQDTSRRYQHDRPQDAGVTEDALGIHEMLSGTAPAGVHAVQPQAADVVLDAMGEGAVGGKTEAQPAAQQEILLDDMNAEGSAQTKQYAPDADALPTPEEVRARLAAMKQARQNPPQ